MAPILQSIEIENFKTYPGKIVLSPLKQFNAIIGPNGSGKSNFMDAISFVMGEKTQNLRVRRLSELVHGASIGQPISKRASVTVVLYDEKVNKERIFQRTIIDNSSEYRIDKNVVTAKEYTSTLQKWNININAKNFLVFQGTVESVAMQNSKEIARTFEELSGSGQFKQEYDQLEKETKKMKEAVHVIYEKKRGLLAQIKEAKFEKHEAEKYSALKKDLSAKKVQYHLFQLFHNENETSKLRRELEPKQNHLNNAEKKKQNLEDSLKEKKKNQGKLNRELAKIEQDIREAEVEVSKKKPHFIKMKEKVSHSQNKLNLAMKTLEEAKTAHEAHLNSILTLGEDLITVQKKKDECEAKMVRESQSQGRNIRLEKEQLIRYRQLKKEAVKQSSKLAQELDSIDRDQRSDQDRLDNLITIKTGEQAKHTQKLHEIEDMRRRLEKLVEHIRTSEQALEVQKRERIALQTDVGSSADRVIAIQREMQEVAESIGDSEESENRKRKTEIIQKLKNIFPGVYDRLINMCHPIDRKYNIAITKCLGKNMDAIVTDTEKTSIKCIQFLKEHKLGIETFLPLNGLKYKAVDENLRSITHPAGVKLVFDVLEFNPPEILNAVLYATNNALVCKTPEDATIIAYELRHDAIALNGTFYKKSGIISGGTHDIAKKARRWDEKHVAELKKKKEKLSDELKEVLKESRKESELRDLESKINGTETRLKLAKLDMENTQKQINLAEEQANRAHNEVQHCNLQIDELENNMNSREKKIDGLKSILNKAEDTVFADFCREIGVRNIREYEGKDLREQEERNKKTFEFDQQIQKILSILEFEENRDTTGNVSRWEKTVNEEKETLETCKKGEAKVKLELQEKQESVEKLTELKLLKQRGIEAAEADVAKIKKEVNAVKKEAGAVMDTISSLESKIAAQNNERHTILMRCKMDETAIPLIEGSLEDVGVALLDSQASQSLSSTSAGTSTQQHEREARMKINYDSLEDLKNLNEKEEIKKTSDLFKKKINELQTTLSDIRSPNMKAVEKLELANGQLKTNDEEYEKLRSELKKSNTLFNKIKSQRSTLFLRCFEHVANEIDRIYKALTQGSSAQAFLVLENPEEPYLAGVTYDCIAPGKPFMPMSNLSGGEKTLAALALLFAIHSHQPAPFLVMDEVDAALDNENIRKVSNYMLENSIDVQIIAISLKEEFYSHADMLIGIHGSNERVTTSRIVTMDFEVFQFD